MSIGNFTRLLPPSSDTPYQAQDALDIIYDVSNGPKGRADHGEA